MKKILLSATLLVLIASSFSFGQATMQVSADIGFGSTQPLVMQYMLLMIAQNDEAALRKVIQVAINKGDLISLRKGEKVHYLSEFDKVPDLVWIRRQGDPVPLVSFMIFFK